MNKHIGSNFDDFLKEENLYDDIQKSGYNYKALQEVLHSSNITLEQKVDVLYDTINDLLVQNEWDTVNEIISNLKYETLCPELIICVVSIIGPVAKYLPSWDQEYENIKNSLKKNVPKEANEIIKRLETYRL